MNILFVCTGNTCRSPMAEGLFNKLISDKNIKDIYSSSAGLSAFNGDEVSSLAVQSVKRYDVDISGHRARKLNEYLLLETDVFVCMTQSHKNILLQFIPQDKIYVLGGGIDDPFGGDSACYDECCDQIYKALIDLLENLLDEVNIVRVNESHISIVAKLEKEIFENHSIEEVIKNQYENGNTHFYLAFFQGEAVGYISTQSIANECSVLNIAVAQEKRCKGIGSKLLDKAIRDAVLRKDEFVTLEVRQSNKSAIFLYEKFGFERVGVRKYYYDKPIEDAIIMTKYLIAKGTTDENTCN